MASKVASDFSDEQVLFLTDIFPTGYTAVDWGEIKGGETVAVFGCGPVGLMAQKCAWGRGAGWVIGLDPQSYRLDMARKAANSETINIEALSEEPHAYEIFSDKKDDCVKVVLTP